MCSGSADDLERSGDKAKVVVDNVDEVKSR